MFMNIKKTLREGQQNVFFHKKFYREILPCSQKKVFLPNPNKPRFEIKKSRIIPSYEITYGHRTNKIGIQMLSKAIYEQVFIDKYKNYSEKGVIEQCKKELEKYEMITKTEDFLKDVDFKIPPIKGKNIEEHFKIIGEEQVKPYSELVNQLLKKFPLPPEKWEMHLGWTRYVPGCNPESVPYPLEEAIVFDVEVSLAILLVT